MALLGDPRLRLDRRSLFIVAGIAGIRSQAGTLGTAGVADWIVDLDLGTHFVDRRQAPHRAGCRSTPTTKRPTGSTPSS
jgi:purine nucleoside permease